MLRQSFLRAKTHSQAHAVSYKLLKNVIPISQIIALPNGPYSNSDSNPHNTPQISRTTKQSSMMSPKELLMSNSSTAMFFRSTHISQSSHSAGDDPNQNRKVNFGSMVTHIQGHLTPNILTELPDSNKLDPSIILKLSETLVNLDLITNNFPDALNIHGKVSYFTILKAVQLFLRGFYLRDGCEHKLLVTHTDVDPDGTTHHQHGIVKGAPKIIVHWKLVHKPIVSDAGKESEIREINVPDLNEFEEGFSGIFCFELNDDCDKILVHNVENVCILGNRNLGGEGFDGFVRAWVKKKGRLRFRVLLGSNRRSQSQISLIISYNLYIAILTEGMETNSGIHLKSKLSSVLGIY